MATTVSNWLRLSRLLPAALIFVALYLLFWSLAPRQYRTSRAPKWPGALFVMLWWFSIVQILPALLGLLNGNTLTYGSLAGVIITLLFFWLIGYGLVIGANLNAALADPPKMGLEGGETD
jgi:membrane protein